MKIRHGKEEHSVSSRVHSAAGGNTMAKVAIVTDSGSGITLAEAKEMGIGLVSIPFMFGDNEKTYFEDINLTRDEFFDRFHNTYRDDATSSLQRDLNAGRRAEIETFSGYLVREVAKLGVAAPVSEKMYGLLRQRAQK